MCAPRDSSLRFRWISGAELRLTPSTQMSSRFTSKTGQAASKRRKKRFPAITHATVAKKKDYEKLAAETKAVIRAWRDNLYSGGSNNSIGFAGLQRVIDRMHNVTPFTRASVFVDFGCGCGTPSFYVSNRFRCKCIGVDYDEKLVEIAREYAAGNTLCSFQVLDFTTLSSAWLREVGATHVFAFDGVFELQNWTALFHSIIGGAPGLTGASVSKFRRLCRGRQWPGSFSLAGEPLEGIALAGGTSSFSMGVWKN